MKKLLLLDAYALIYRAHFAFIKAPRYNSSNMNTSAAYGFLITLEQLLEKEKPDLIAAAFDLSGPTFRHEVFPEYKANREKMPEDLRNCIPYIRRIIEAHNIRIVEKEGFEADDIIGSLSAQASSQGYDTYMVTPDKDYCQLVKENVFLYKPSRGKKESELLGVQEVNELFQIDNPKQVIDVLALWGDSVDNVPGAPGIGEKTSKTLINKYKSVENIYENIDDLKGKQKENLINFREQIELSKQLVTIDTGMEFDFELEDLRVQDKQADTLISIYQELEFASQLKKMGVGGTTEKTSQIAENDLFGSQAEVKLKSLKEVETAYKLVDTEEAIEALLEKLASQPNFCFDTETTHLNPAHAELVAISFSWKPNEAYMLSFSEGFDATKHTLEKFSRIFEDENITKIGQNIKYDIIILKNYQIQVKGPLFDTMIAQHLLQSHTKNNLNFLAEHYLKYRPIAFSELNSTKQKDFDIRTVPTQELLDYACEDADITLQIYEILAKNLKGKGFEKLFYEIEMPLIHVLAEMEHQGVCIDLPFLKELSTTLTKELVDVEAAIIELAGESFNVSSPKQLGVILFEKLGLPAPKKTKTKQYSTNEETLKKLEDHEIVQKVLRFRNLKKLISTYIDSLPKLVNDKTNRIHTSYNQAVTQTGRLSSNNPNLQNIPIRSEDGKKLREAFVASSEDRVFLSADYSQVELRLMAILSEDAGMLDAFSENRDIHAETASRIFNVPLEEVDKNQRNTAKIANFSIIYGVSSFGLSQNINTSRKEAKQLIDNYFQSYPKIKAFMDNSIQQARNDGYVSTLKGRQQVLPDINSQNAFTRANAERNAINTPIQGTSADIIKLAMINIFRAFEAKGLQSKMIMQVHDELNFDVLKSELEEVKSIVKYEMENVLEAPIKLEVNMNEAANWLLSH